MSTIDNLHSIDNSICATTAVLFLAVLYVGLALCLIFFLSKPVARLRYAQSLKEKLPHVFAIVAISLTIATIYIQSHLADDDALIFTEIGSEKMRYLVGCATVITKDASDSINLDDGAITLARKMLRNPKWQTKNEY